MKLLKLDAFITRCFDEDGRPDLRTARYWCEQGHLPARRIGKLWFVDVDVFERTHESMRMDRIRGVTHGAFSLS